MSEGRQILNNLTDFQKTDLVFCMKEWVNDNVPAYADLRFEDMSSVSDEELLREIEAHYQGGIHDFVIEQVINNTY